MKSSIKSLPIVALCGFLGSGKTTLLRRWSRDESLAEAALIVHDLSEFGLDAELLSAEGATPSQGLLSGRVAALHGSHARDQLHTSLAKTLEEITHLSPPPPLILCESTGAARPWPLIKALTQDKRFHLKHFIVSVDALNLHRDLADGLILTGEQPSPTDDALNYAAEILAEQLAFASIIILTKIDTIEKEIVEKQVRILQKIQPLAAIGLSAQAGIQLHQLETTPAPKLNLLEQRAKKLGLNDSTATSEDVDALLFRDPRPFHPERLHQACLNHLSTGLYRTKGFLWLASRPADVLLWQQSGSQIALELTGSWRAEVANDTENKLLPEEKEHLKHQLASEHSIFGDRHNELTLIGLKTARENFYAALQDALCTEQEISAWQNAETFPDPWPTSINHIE